MRKIVLYIAMSLDGYIADKDGGVNWLADDRDDRENMGSYSVFYETIDTVILGYKTYRQIVTDLSPDNWFYTGKKSYVLTHREIKSTNDIIFTRQKPEDLARQLKSESGKDIWICGGGDIVSQFLNKNLIDRYHISVIPTILGEGIPLFSGRKTEHKLKLLSTQNYNGIVDLVYEPRA